MQRKRIFHKSRLKPLILTVALSVTGLIISRIVSDLRLFWLLLGFSLIFSAERWFRHETNKHKIIGRLYRLILNCSILSLLGLLVWSAIKLFSHTSLLDPLIESLLFIAEFVMAFWLLKVVSKNSWRFPSMKLTTACIVGAFLIFAFAGVQPMSGYKDSAINVIKSGNLLSGGQTADINSQFELKLTNIEFGDNSPASALGSLVGAQIPSLIAPMSGLPVDVDVTPKDSFTGEPFRIVTLGNDKIGYTTVVESRPLIYLALFSRDGYYFGSTGPITWTKDELQLPNSSNRNYYQNQNILINRIKHVTIVLPYSDKVTVALVNESNQFVDSLQQQEWEYMLTNKDWLLGKNPPTQFDSEHVRASFQSIFNKYFRFEIIDQQRFLDLQASKK